MSVFFILFLLLLFAYCFAGNKKIINYYLEQVIKVKSMNKHYNKKFNKLSTINRCKQKEKFKKAQTMMNIIKDNNSTSKKQKKVSLQKE